MNLFGMAHASHSQKTHFPLNISIAPNEIGPGNTSKYDKIYQ